jgi:hypothetical protein
MELVIQVGGPKQLMLLVAPIGLPYIYLRHLTAKLTLKQTNLRQILILKHPLLHD